LRVESLEAKGASEEIVPEDEEDDNDGDGETWMEPLAVGVGTVEVLRELAAVGFYIGGIMHFLAALQLFFALGLGHEAVELVLALAGIDVYATEAAGFTG